MKSYWKVGLSCFLLVFLLVLVFTPTTFANTTEFTADSGVYGLIGGSINDHSQALYLWEHNSYLYVAIATAFQQQHILYSLTINNVPVSETYWLPVGANLKVRDTAAPPELILDEEPDGKANANYYWLVGKVNIAMPVSSIVVNLSSPGGFELDNVTYMVRGALNVFHQYPPDAAFQDFDQSEASNTIGGIAAGMYQVEPEDPPKAGYEYASVTVRIDGIELLSVNAGATSSETFAHGTVDINSSGVVTVALESTSNKIIDINYLYVKTYIVTYNANTGTGTLVDPDSPYNFNATVTVLDPEDDGNISKTGYSFVEWNTAADGSGTDYDPGDTFSMPAANVVLYAQWEAIDYTVTYNANNGTGAPVDSKSPYPYDDEVEVLGPGTMTKTGYTFVKWNTKADGTGADYDPGDTFSMPAANVVLYAQWEAMKYTLRINYYYGSVGGNIAAPVYINNTLKAGDTYSVNSPVISGYRASQATVAGIMPANDVTINVIYTATVKPTPPTGGQLSSLMIIGLALISAGIIISRRGLKLT